MQKVPLRFLIYDESIPPKVLESLAQAEGINLCPLADAPYEREAKDEMIRLFVLGETSIQDPSQYRKIQALAGKRSIIWLGEDAGALAHFEENLLFASFSGSSTVALARLIRQAFLLAQTAHRLKKVEQKLLITEDEVQELQSIGIALTTEKDLDKLLKTIIRLSTNITNSDAGVLYLVEKEEDNPSNRYLRFVLNQNYSLTIDSVPFTMPLDKTSLSGYTAITREILNIPDSYNISAEKEYSHSKKFDEMYQYWTRSILTIPMQNHKDEVIGVIQLINKKKTFSAMLREKGDFERWVEPYSERDEKLAQALASQAAVALENAILYENIQKLFEGFVKASVQAIESRDPTTSGHSERVALYSYSLALAVNETQNGTYSGVNFSEEELKELRYASLLHDFGKVGVRECVLVKAHKLSPLQEALLVARIEYIKNDLVRKNLEDKLQFLIENGNSGYAEAFSALEFKLKTQYDQLDYYRREIFRINQPTVVAESDWAILEEIRDYTYTDLKGETHTLLSAEEYQKLTIPRGSLDEKERIEIESHVSHSYKFLKEIPWTREMKHVPEIAHAHHEKLNGKGYPRGLSDKEIMPQSKIMAIADIFDALTASDRPYKKALSIEKALQILREEASHFHVDGELLDIFIREKVYDAVPHNQEIKPLF